MPFFLQIFCKDVRRLAPFLLAFLALQTVFAIGTIHSVGLVDPLNNFEGTLALTEALLFVSWALLIALVILEDPLIGDNAFWLTRPYSWRSLLAAKVLFVLAFLNLPLLISDCLILKSLGLSLNFAHLLLRQLPLIALVIIPLFAFAAIASRLSQFWLFLVIALIAMAVETFAIADKFETIWSYPRVPDSVALILIALCALPAIAIQFARRVNYTRIWLGALFALTIPYILSTTHLGKNSAFFIQQHPEPTAGNPWHRVHLDFGSDKTESPKSPPFKSGLWLGLSIPVRVQGLPPDEILGGEGETFLGDAPKSFHSSLIHESDGSYHLGLSHFRSQVLSNASISIRSSLQVWVLNAEPTYRRALSPFALVNIPKVGICQVSAALTCWHGPVRPLPVTIATKAWTKLLGKTSDSFTLYNDGRLYDEMAWDLSPIGKRTLSLNASEIIARGDKVSFAPHFLVGSFNLKLRADQFRLSDASPEFSTQFILKDPTP